MVARITISHNNVITVEASTETLNLLSEEFKAPDFSECFVFGQFRKERMKMVRFLIRSPDVPTTALLPIGFLDELVKFFKKHGATYKVIDNRKFEKLEFSDEEIEKCLGYINLYDYQVESVKAMLESPNGIIKATTAAGKCLAKGTKILMFDGSLKNVENVVVGDKIMGPDSLPRNVLSTCSGQEMMYDIIPQKGTKYRVNESHILSLKMTNGYRRKKDGQIIDISVKDYLKQTKTFKHCAKGYRVPIDWEEQPLPSHIDPYFLGVWLGDGSSSNPAITNIDLEIIQYLQEYAKEKNMRLYEDVSETRTTTYRFTSQNGRLDAGRGKNCNEMLNQLRNLNLINNKHIPQIYKSNSKDNRLQLLAGLIDTDGSYSNRNHSGGTFDYITKSKTLARDVVFIARSVGLAAYAHGCIKSAHINHKGVYYRICISGNLDIVPTRVVRKQAQSRKQKKDVLVYGINIKPVGIETYYGFEIDGDKRFVLGDFSVTHNTEIFIAYCKLAKRKTLILFARIDLAKQTLRRMKKAGLDAGIVQGNNVDENHQVVMATVQSGHKLEGQYDCIIVDECHRAAGEQYQILLKNKHTLYRYGFSATPFVKKNKLQTKRTMAWLGNIMYTVHAEKLMDEGRISKPTIHIIPVKKPDGIADLKWPFCETAGIIENKYRNNIIAEVANNLSGQKLILVQKIDHGEKLQALINNSYFLYGESDVKEREEYVARFEAGEPITLIASTIFDEGIDIKTVNHVIITGGGQSFIKVLQRLGRGLRITETKKTVDIYDFYDYTNPTLKKHSDERIKIYRSEGFNEIKVFKIEDFRKDIV